MLVIKVDKEDRIQIDEDVTLGFRWNLSENRLGVYIDVPREV